ncbi:ISAs1 family transposase [Azotobacter beijerinckii]|uniref:ISAs1 family transposase n=1 Tax=Azotobacter beijerinckii TaxID=170623 RepID=UPI0029550BA3|nr:ISAs1 family transposase [Azotobacter beijerinckii]MDV7210466.1 ISAs1 family transposase [Azotobacter beijerinckii]
MLPNPQPYFAALVDPRRETRNKLHALQDIVMITLCATLCGHDDWVSIEDFAHENEAWLREFLPLSNGIPSHDTLSDVMGRLERKAFADAFGRWMQDSLPEFDARHIALDGKTLRGSRQNGSAVHLMSAFATQARLVLAQQAVAGKSNEIMALPELMKQMDLRGAVISIDAIGCQKTVAGQIIAAGADYVLALKDNHPTLREEVALWLDEQIDKGRLPRLETTGKDHGRVEVRRYSLSCQLDWLEPRTQWAGLAAVGRVESIRHVGGQETRECRYFLSSITDLEVFAGVVRNHWAIENQQHWVLDVQFREDANRSRKDHSASNLALIRRAALSLIRENDNSKLSIGRRRMRACTNAQYRTQLLFGVEGS